jgi:Sec7-like guanine-nucleotide exchange factor
MSNATCTSLMAPSKADGDYTVLGSLEGKGKEAREEVNYEYIDTRLVLIMFAILETAF